MFPICFIILFRVNILWLFEPYKGISYFSPEYRTKTKFLLIIKAYFSASEDLSIIENIILLLLDVVAYTIMLFSYTIL